MLSIREQVFLAWLKKACAGFLVLAQLALILPWAGQTGFTITAWPEAAWFRAAPTGGGQPFSTPAVPSRPALQPVPRRAFLNDRAAQVTGTANLLLPGFITDEGLDGSGQTVAVADSGLGRGRIGPDLHPDLTALPNGRPKVLGLLSLDPTRLPADPTGHGTHVAATVLGTGAASNGAYRGIAPGASLFFLSILNRQNEIALPADLRSVFQTAYDAGARIQVHSWGLDHNDYGEPAYQIDSFIRQQPDALLLFGAGNGGSGTLSSERRPLGQGKPAPAVGGSSPAAARASTSPNVLTATADVLSVENNGNITAEANAKNALVVGASENPRPAWGEQSDHFDQVASFSSRGPAADGRIRPDLVAPGTGIISARAAGTGEPLPGNEYYTVMSGTSMATAVAAGAAALLRQYLLGKYLGQYTSLAGSATPLGPSGPVKYGEGTLFPTTSTRPGLPAQPDALPATSLSPGYLFPSASLLKALLINGARPLTGDRQAEGFGLLDLTRTILALKHGTFRFADDPEGLTQGANRTYTYEVTTAAAPLKATLAWTDPPAVPGSKTALVNDLDLVVIGPDGAVYLGNDSGGHHQPDRRNNVEQVTVDHPKPGRYIITVSGYRVNTPAVFPAGNSPEAAMGPPRQDFSLVFGQTLRQGVVQWVDPAGSGLLLTDGSFISLPPDTVWHISADGRVIPNPKPADLRPGADIYLYEKGGRVRALYGAYQTIDASGMEGLTLARGQYIREVDDPSFGGFPVAGRASLTVNGVSTKKADDIVPGSDLTGVVTPSTQELAWATASYTRLEKVALETVEGNGKAIRLWSYPGSFPIRPGLDIKRRASWKEALDYDLPFSALPPLRLTDLEPLTILNLTISPRTSQVTYLEVTERRVEGILEEVDGGKREIRLKSGGLYSLAPAAFLTVDGVPATWRDLRPGQQVEALLDEKKEQEIVKLSAYSILVYGRSLYVNAPTGNLILRDSFGRIMVFSLPSGVQVFWYGQPLSLAALKGGEYLRLAIEPVQKKVWRIDVATADGEPLGGIFQGFAAATGEILTKQGERYAVTSKTLITKQGLRVRPEDLRPGEKIRFVRAFCGALADPVLVEVEASPQTGLTPPAIALRAVAEGETLRLLGETDAQQVYLYLNDTVTVAPPITGGKFEQVLRPSLWDGRSGQIELQAVAVAGSGGVAEVRLAIPWQVQTPVMVDTAGHWAERDIDLLLRLGVVQGYPGRIFRPEQGVTRGEFLKMLAQALDWEPPVAVDRLPFTDGEGVPLWLKPYLAAAAARGILKGYEDGSSGWSRLLSRAEMMVFLYRAIRLFPEAFARSVLQKDTSPESASAAPGGQEIGRLEKTVTGWGAPSLVSVETVFPADWADFPAWAKEAGNFAVARRLVSGRSPGRLEPNAVSTRAEAATVLARLLRLLGKVPLAPEYQP